MLQGTLDTFSFAELLLLAARKSVTGSLQVKTAKSRTVVHLREGQIVGIDGEDAASAGFRRRIEDAVAHLLDADRGSFELRPAGHTLDSEGGVEVRAALAGARRLLNEWREVESVIPSLDARPLVVPNLDSQGVTLTREQWRLLQVIDGHRSIKVLARTLGNSQPEVARGLRDLLDAGAIQFASPSTVAVPLPGQVGSNGSDPDDTRETILISASQARARRKLSVGAEETAAVAAESEARPVERRRGGWSWLRRRRSADGSPGPDPAGPADSGPESPVWSRAG